MEELTALKRKERPEFKEERLRKEMLERERVLRAEQTGEKRPEEGQEKNDEPKRKRRMTSTQMAQELLVYSESRLDKGKSPTITRRSSFSFPSQISHRHLLKFSSLPLSIPPSYHHFSPPGRLLPSPLCSLLPLLSPASHRYTQPQIRSRLSTLRRPYSLHACGALCQRHRQLFLMRC